MALLLNCLSIHHTFRHSLPYLVHQVYPSLQGALACLACLTDTYHRLQRYGKSCRIYLPNTSVYTRCCKLLLSVSSRRIPACNLQWHHVLSSKPTKILSLIPDASVLSILSSVACSIRLDLVCSPQKSVWYSSSQYRASSPSSLFQLHLVALLVSSRNLHSHLPFSVHCSHCLV